ncbi:uncharacterized protein N7473_001199 [Penicillium subrubescens]|uniref:uncharacterized protein n=1 Tax=Penicillium subrubescens TaxID=1316194 RepID=UPI0025451907|nr:uncharacterized protein N7473_001199 [Penicillium subrubescens]KAJ5911896.1 hypothetical protein N7473_001199 [Penicillium subrubescens]
MFKTGNRQSSLHPILDTIWSGHPGLSNWSTSFEQQMQPGLSSNNFWEQKLVSPFSSGHKNWNERTRSLSQSGPCQSSENLETPWTQTFSLNSTKKCHDENEMLRFHICLGAPTAMVSDQGEKPETYLNKGQIYYIRIVDTAPPPSDSEKTTYRTFVGVSFKEQDQEMSAEAYWRLWAVRRAVSNLDETDHEHRAVEFADEQRPWVELTEEFTNGFSVTWTIDSLTSLNECHIPVRFNFLSTDFTLVKGVKGLSARLCVKTDQVNTTELPYKPEVCFCKIRVFRDHGAERKQSNDVTHVKRRIKKLTEKATTLVPHEALRRRRRGNPVAGKMKKLEAAFSSLTDEYACSTEPDELKAYILPNEPELQKKLVKLRKMLLSGCPESVLSLQGGRDDDPETQTIRLQSGCNSTPKQRATTSEGSLRGDSDVY